jgi:hypothetical protein
MDFQLQFLLICWSRFGANFGQKDEQMFQEDNMQIQRFPFVFAPLQWAFID